MVKTKNRNTRFRSTPNTKTRDISARLLLNKNSTNLAAIFFWRNQSLPWSRILAFQPHQLPPSGLIKKALISRFSGWVEKGEHFHRFFERVNVHSAAFRVSIQRGWKASRWTKQCFYIRKILTFPLKVYIKYSSAFTVIDATGHRKVNLSPKE